jgi:predicted O-linked N-acetylglucosamine transferase (SPINDLY family)
MNHQLKQAYQLLYSIPESKIIQNSATQYTGTQLEGPKKARKLLEKLRLESFGQQGAEIDYMIGLSWIMQGSYKEAIGYLSNALSHYHKLDQKQKTGYLIGLCYFHLGLLSKAELILDALRLNSEGDIKYWILRGDVQIALGKPDTALQCFGKANAIEPRNEEIAYKVAKVYEQQGSFEKALEFFDITLAMKSDYIKARVDKAEVLRGLRRFDQSMQAFEENLAIQPDHIESKMGIALCYKDQGNYDKSITLCHQILHENPNLPLVRMNLGLCLLEIGRFNESEEQYKKALNQLPHAQLFSNYLMGMHYNPEKTKKEIYEAHLKWESLHKLQPMAKPDLKNWAISEKIKVGFISGGFRQHPVGWMITGPLESIDKRRFELHFYTTHPHRDALSKRLQDTSTSWTSVIGWTDDAIAERIRRDDIDILVELSGHAADNKLKVITKRPARVHVKWVGGLFNTSGLSDMDFLISDSVQTPEGADSWYTEKLVRLPHDYVSYSPPEYLPPIKGLPLEKNGYLTLGCFNNPVKINEVLLHHWANLLKQLPSARLLLKGKAYDSVDFVTRIKDKMASFGVDITRVEIQGASEHKVLLDTYNRVDIALDPWPYSGGLTTIEALMMGVPVVTYPGYTFAGRHAATHLHHAGVPELIANNWTDYKDKIVLLALDKQRLLNYRTSLRHKLLHSSVCDSKGFSKSLEKAFTEMLRQWQKKEKDPFFPGFSPIDI